MVRVKFVKDHKNFKKGDTESFTKNEAFGLIDAGYAVVSKDMAESDYKVTSVDTALDSKKLKVKEK